MPARDHYWPINGATREVALVETAGSESQANARLIAAAPDLLAACKDASDFLTTYNLGQTDLGRPVVNRLLAAIANAEGPSLTRAFYPRGRKDLGQPGPAAGQP